MIIVNSDRSVMVEARDVKFKILESDRYHTKCGLEVNGDIIEAFNRLDNNDTDIQWQVMSYILEAWKRGDKFFDLNDYAATKKGFIPRAKDEDVEIVESEVVEEPKKEKRSFDQVLDDFSDALAETMVDKLLK